MKYCSIILCHYSKIDDFGEKAAGKNPPKRSDLLRLTLESLAKNTDYPAEIIVVDNGGNPDDTDYLVGKVREGVINTLVRFKENRHFAMAWNTGAKIATGDYISFICNDIEFSPGWLSACVGLLEKHDSNKLVATPFITYDKRKMTTVLEGGARLNPRSGSNCMVMTKEFWEVMGEFEHHRIGGTVWYNKLKQMGFATIAPPEDLAVDRGWRAGVNFSKFIKVEKKLLDGSSVDFTSKLQV